MFRLKEILWVFGLASLAGLIRYGLGRLFPGPWTIVGINFLGIFLLVYFIKIKLVQTLPSYLLTGLGVGFLGGFTTLASPLLDMVKAFQRADYSLFTLYLLVHLLGGLLVAYLAYRLAGGGKHE